MKKNLRTLLAALLALVMILSVTAALAYDPVMPPSGDNIISPSIGGISFSPSSGGSSSAGAAKGYISIPGSVGLGEIKFVSTRKCYIFKDGYKEYFDFQVEDGKLILINADGEHTEVTVGEDGKGALEVALGNGDIFTAEFGSRALTYIVNNGVFPIEKQKAPK